MKERNIFTARNKLNSRFGFSLVELLTAMLILSMVTVVVAGGIPVAKNAYEKITLTANAQVLLSTAVNALRNELGTASGVKIDDDGALKYTRANGSTSKIYLKNKNIVVREYADFTKNNTEGFNEEDIDILRFGGM